MVQLKKYKVNVEFKHFKKGVEELPGTSRCSVEAGGPRSTLDCSHRSCWWMVFTAFPIVNIKDIEKVMKYKK